MTEEKEEQRPLSFLISLWHGYVIAGIFLLYGGVKIVLSFLDHDFSDMASLIMFVALGLILLMIALSYNEGKKIGWYGLITLNGLIVISTLINYAILESIIILIFSVVVLLLLFKSDTKKYLIN